MRRICAVAIGAALAIAPPAVAADTQTLLVHGYGDAEAGKDCNGSTWKNALAGFQLERSSMTTIGYYPGDRGRCDVMIGDGEASNARPIQDIARDLAQYIHGQGRPVDIVAHSMGGLIARVALLGSAQGWEGFPPKLDVDDVVTLGTPHQGVARPSAHDDRQWQQMDPGSGFIERLHEKGSGLGDDWADGTDWSLVGSHGDATVEHDSAIDKGRHADQKYGYRDVGHGGIRTLYGESRYDLTYWHAAGDHPAHHTMRGWAPLKTAFQAATRTGDGLPR
jgi:pimeloyl-ACP methyl ester carboxylesterase